jgi:hypothetical protein
LEHFGQENIDSNQDKKPFPVTTKLNDRMARRKSKGNDNKTEK